MARAFHREGWVYEEKVDGWRMLAHKDHGLKEGQQVIERGYEGLVAKDPESTYVGGRTQKWHKVKQPLFREGERGWEPKRKRGPCPYPTLPTSKPTCTVSSAGP